MNNFDSLVFIFINFYLYMRKIPTCWHLNFGYRDRSVYHFTTKRPQSLKIVNVFFIDINVFLVI